MHVTTVVNLEMASLTSLSWVYFDDCINTLIPIMTKQHKSVVNEKRTAKPAESEYTPQYKKKHYTSIGILKHCFQLRFADD